jgi:hypothetical protein
MTRLDKDLAALATMSPAQLHERWEQTGKGAAPAVSTGLLRQLLAQALQERRFGGLPAMVQRELQRAASGRVPQEQPARTPSLMPGSRLIREWNGRTIAVEVREDGFYWEERVYRSLSQISRKVTGAHWSGPRFFGLRRHC